MFDWLKGGKTPEPRKGMPSPRVNQDEFKRRFRLQFQDSGFEALQTELDKIAQAAWGAYSHSRKSPRTREAGPEFSDPSYPLAQDWIYTHEAVKSAQHRHDDKNAPLRILLINCSSRSEHTCPSEMSKSYRLAEIAAEVAGSQGSFAGLAPVGPYRSADALPCSGTSIASSCETRPDAQRTSVSGRMTLKDLE